MLRSELVAKLDLELHPQLFHDYCPNGLQIEGRNEISRIITGVSLNQALIDQAIARNADAIIVHHGMFWSKEDPRLIGIKYQRIAKLIKHDINLIVYHLPLDNHPQLGNNAQLANLLDIEVTGQCGEQNLLWHGNLRQPRTLSSLIGDYQRQTGHPPQYFGHNDKIISKIAWCSGGADGMFADAINLGVDCYFSGEVSEPTMSLSQESDVAYIAGGHYVSERLGIQVLTDWLRNLGLSAEFVDIYNPI